MVVGWLLKHENITKTASNSVEFGAGAELGNIQPNAFGRKAKPVKMGPTSSLIKRIEFSVYF